MRIAFVVHAYSPSMGGAESYAQGLAVACSVLGNEVHVVAPSSDSAEVFYEFGHGSSANTRDIEDNVIVHRIGVQIPRWPRRREGPFPVQVAHKIWRRYAVSVHRVLDQIDPERVVALPHAFPNVEAALTRTPHVESAYVPMLHESDPNWNPDQIRDFVRQADATVALTNWERNRLIQSYGSEPTSTFVVPPGIAVPDSASLPESPSSSPYVLALGRRSASKNLHTIAQAVREVRADGTDLQFLLVGPAGDTIADERLAPYDEFVRLHGQASEAEKWSAIRGAVATISMSTQESYGISSAESLAMGTPSISLRTPISSELAETTDLQFLVDDIGDLVATIHRLMAQDLRRRPQGNPDESVPQRTWEESAELLINALHANPT